MMHGSAMVHQDVELEKKTIPKCDCGKVCLRCKCTAGDNFSYQTWIQRGILAGSDIKVKIVHRSPIKVYYSSKANAKLDNYTDYSPFCVNTKGVIHPFSGLRGDAKALW